MKPIIGLALAAAALAPAFAAAQEVTLRVVSAFPEDQYYVQRTVEVIDGYGWPIHALFDLNWQEKTKFRVDPGFYNAEVSLVVNLDKWKSLPPAARDFLTRQALAYEGQNEFWKSYNQNEAKRQAEAGIQTISFDAETSRKYVQQANEVGWAGIIKTCPQYGPHLRRLLGR